MRFVSREEARNVLECLSPTLVRAVIAMAITDTKTSKDLADVLGMSVRNAQRLISSLESLRVVKVIRYGKLKIIASLSSCFEREVIEGLKTLVPLVADTMRVPPMRADRYCEEVAIALTRILGIRSRPRDSFINIVRDVLRNGLERSRVPRWLRRIISVEELHRLRIEGGTAKQPLLYPDNTPGIEVSELVTY